MSGLRVPFGGVHVEVMQFWVPGGQASTVAKSDVVVVWEEREETERRLPAEALNAAQLVKRRKRDRTFIIVITFTKV